MTREAQQVYPELAQFGEPQGSQASTLGLDLAKSGGYASHPITITLPPRPDTIGRIRVERRIEIDPANVLGDDTAAENL